MKKAFSILRNHFWLKLIALIVALVGWTGVVYSENPPDAITLSVAVPQQASLLPEGFVLVHPIPNLTISVLGTRDNVLAFHLSDLTVTPNFSHITSSGMHDIPIDIVNGDTHVQLQGVPTSVPADVDKLVTVSLPVVVRVTSAPPAGYIVQHTSASPSSVSVSLPQRDAAHAQAVVSISLSNITASVQQVEEVGIVDRLGAAIQHAVFTPTSTTVSVAMAATTTSRVSAVVPTLAGVVANGYEISGIIVNPQIVTLSGSQADLAHLSEVHTGIVDVNGLSSTTQVTVPLTLPSGVSSSSGSVQVQVTVQQIPAQSSSPSPSASP